MLIIPGTGATLTPETLEGYTLSLLEFGQTQELTAAKNPQGLNFITSSIDRDNGTLTGNVTFPVEITTESNGTIIISAADYLNAVTFTPGTGGTITASNWVAALINCTVRQRNREIDTSYNPTSGLSPITWGINSSSLAGRKATFSADYNLPIEALILPTGGTTYTAKEYLS